MRKKLVEIPLIGRFIYFLKQIRLDKNSFSLYDLLRLYTVGIIRGALTYRASAISYSFFVAIFPFLLFILNLIPYVPISDFQNDFWNFINDLLPPGTHDFFADIFFDIAEKKRVGLLSSVFVLSIFLMTNGILAIFGSFEYSYHVKITRNFIRSYIISTCVAIVLALILLLIVALFIYYEVYIVPHITSLDFFKNSDFLLHWSKIAFLVLVTYLATSVLFFFGIPKGNGRSFFSPGAILTTILFGLTTFLFGLYIENFSQYNQLYGSIGALLIFLFYIWLNSNILLLGFDFNVALLRLKEEKR